MMTTATATRPGTAVTIYAGPLEVTKALQREDRAAQLAVLQATIDTWQNDFTVANGTGTIDAAAWERSIAFMSSLPDSPVAKPVTVADCIDATFATR